MIIECNDGLTQESIGHASLQKVIALTNLITPQKVILTHLSWRVDYEEFSRHLPSNFSLAYDKLKINLE